MATGWQRTSCGPPSNKVNRTNNIWDTIIKGQQRHWKRLLKNGNWIQQTLGGTTEMSCFCLWFTNFAEISFRMIFQESNSWPKASLCLKLFLPPKKHILWPIIAQKQTLLHNKLPQIQGLKQYFLLLNPEVRRQFHLGCALSWFW